MPKKELGQHWLKDPFILSEIVDAAHIDSSDTVLEIGPGLGTLTSGLLNAAKNVIAVEFDDELARKLPGQFPGKSLEVRNEDILTFDLSVLPQSYVVVANVPYYITSKIVQKLMTAENKPRISVLLVQKEVARRIAAEPGDLSILGVSAQVYSEASLGIEVPREFFTPPPQVDSQVVILKTREEPLITPEEEKVFFQIIKAGFSEKRKKLRSSLAGGLGLEKSYIDELLRLVNIPSEARAQELSIADWLKLVAAVEFGATASSK